MFSFVNGYTMTYSNYIKELTEVGEGLDIIAFVEEFGTLPRIQVVKALIGENALFQAYKKLEDEGLGAHKKEDMQYWKQYLLKAKEAQKNAFFVDKVFFKKEVLRLGMDALFKLYNR